MVKRHTIETAQGTCRGSAILVSTRSAFLRTSAFRKEHREALHTARFEVLRFQFMGVLDFKEIASLINYSRTTTINLDPLAGVPGRWTLHRGEHRVHTSAYAFALLYLHSGASLDDMKAAIKAVDDLPNTDVLYPPSLRKPAEFSTLFAKAKGVWTTRDYLVSFLKDELNTYLERLAALAPQFYIDPRVETPSGIPIRNPNPLLSFLRDPDSTSSPLSGKLAILLAEPGQGKTYTSRHLVSSLARSGTTTLPLLVDSSQWQTLSVEHQRSLPKTIAHSFDHFEATIGWLRGHEEEFLQATLKADIFRIVFDGFDEYILHNRGEVGPTEVLEALQQLASETGARIVLTSRTAFWDTNIPEAELRGFLDKNRALIYLLQPFNLEQAKHYFSGRLKNQRQATYAAQTYGVLSKDSKSLVGRGFVLSLLADLAERTLNGERLYSGDKYPLAWLIQAMCEREVLRQQLPLSSSEQLRFLRTLAVEGARGVTANTELLELAIRVVRPTLDPSSVAGAIEKLKSHPLIEHRKDQDIWTFRQEQIRIMLIAEEMIKWSEVEVQGFMQRAALDAAARQDVGSTIVDLLQKEHSTEVALEHLAKICQALSAPSAPGLPPSNDGRRLAATIALTAVDPLRPTGSSHLDRAGFLLRICGNAAVEALEFNGTIARYDFCGVSFKRCRFDHSTWANCRFDEMTTFSQCEFFGGNPPAHCEGLGSAVMSECTLDPEFEAMLNGVRVGEGKKRYSVDELKSDLSSVLTKFVIKGGVGLKTINELHLNRGTIGASRYRGEIMEVLLSTILESHKISGGVTGYNIRPKAVEAVKFYAANNVFTGPIREAFDRLKVRLSLS
jgi:hypothetical protein